MRNSNIGSSSAIGTGGFGKTVLVGLFVGASALSQANPVTDQPIYVDDSCGSATGARHGGSRVECSFQVNQFMNQAPTPTATVQTSPVAPVVVASIPAPALTSSKPTVTATVLAPPAPVAVVPPAVAPQQIIAAAPPVAPAASGGSNQPATTTVPAPTPASTLPSVPSISVMAVPEPGTFVLLGGGILALVGIRWKRSSNDR